ncbi:MAG TPA: CBS domain-containing protein [Ignavibacteriales bacterium]|nr:CBS domain-containing protein [Ignavibacteriales bacterium]
MSTALWVTYPEETVQAAAMKMARNNIGRLPVVDRNNPKELLGYFGRSSATSGAPQFLPPVTKEAGRSLSVRRAGLNTTSDPITKNRLSDFKFYTCPDYF